MGLAIICNDIPLDIKPGSSTEIERSSPFFAMDNILAEFSTVPITMPYSQNNAQALGLTFQFYTERRKKKYTVDVWDADLYKGRCTMVVEAGTLNILHPERSEMVASLMFGISDFYQLVADKKLSDLNLGGPRSMHLTTDDSTDGTNGYWQHFHQTWTNASIPYVFAPVRNDHFDGEDGDVEWMNKLDANGKLAFEVNINKLVPMVRLKYVLECIFLEHGWNVDFSALTDDVWDKLLLVNVTPITWFKVEPTLSGGGSPVVAPVAMATITIDLSQHMPTDKTIGSLILGLLTRFAWAPLFNILTKTVRIVPGKYLGTGQRKDWTAYVDPNYKSDFSDEEKIYGFSNEVDSNDEAPVQPDFTNVGMMAPAISKAALPAASIDLADRVVFCLLDNVYFQCTHDSTANTYSWQLFGDNIYNYEPPGFTDTINTTITPLAMSFINHRTDRWQYWPVMKHPTNKPIGYRLMIYHGMVEELDSAGNFIPGTAVPIMGAINYPGLLGYAKDWSNVYESKTTSGALSNDTGIVQFWWKDFLTKLQDGEVADFRLTLPRHEIDRFSWDDEILIQNIKFLVKRILEPMPYTNFVLATLKRIDKARPLTGTPIEADTPDGRIYARLTVHSIYVSNVASPPGVSYTTRSCSVRIALFADLAATIPYTPTATLYVLVATKKYEFGNQVAAPEDFYPVNAAQQDILVQVFYDLVVNTATTKNHVYQLEVSPSNEYVVV